MTHLVIATVSALAISAMCSLFEAVLYATPWSAISRMIKAGHGSGKLFEQLRIHVHKPITAILSLNTIANTLGAALSGAFAAALFGQKWFILFSICFTLVMLIFSEILPKTIGVIYSRRLARFVAYPIQVIVWIFTPFVWTVDKITAIFSLRRKYQVDPQDIVGLASMGRKEGVIEFMEEKVIENILVLKHKQAHEIMTPRSVVFSLSADLTLSQAISGGTAWPHSRVPIYKDDPEDIVGILMHRDAHSMLCAGLEQKKLADIMRPVHFVPTYARADKLLKEFLDKRQHLFAVVDAKGNFAGVITLEDVLEEIIGREIVDEFDPAIDMQALARKRRMQAVKNI